jgi:hypothetical protein
MASCKRHSLRSGLVFLGSVWVEFGVAGGNGLLAMENIATEVERLVSVEIELFGFDAGTGLPAPVDYRDLPYLFAEAAYEMDETKLRSRLNLARLIMGQIADTLTRFLRNHNPAPIGFLSFDVDYYSSTADALKLLDSPSESLLPRVFCYFDDVIGDDLLISCDAVGQLRAIKEFNEQREMRKLAPIYGLRHKRKKEKDWHCRGENWSGVVCAAGSQHYVGGQRSVGSGFSWKQKGPPVPGKGRRLLGAARR